MPDTLTTIHAMTVLACAPDGEKITSEQAALDLIGEAMAQGADLVLVPVERFEDAFFQLKTGLVGQIVQKFVTYRRHLVIMGDISRYIAGSRAFKDFVSEANRGKQIWFVASLPELDERLKPRP